MEIIINKKYNILKFTEKSALSKNVSDNLEFKFPDATEEIGISLTSKQQMKLIKFLIKYYEYKESRSNEI